MIQNIFEMNFARNCVKNMEFYFQSNCPMSKSLNHCTVTLNYSQSIKINIGPSDGGAIIPLTHRPTVLY